VVTDELAGVEALGALGLLVGEDDGLADHADVGAGGAGAALLQQIFADALAFAVVEGVDLTGDAVQALPVVGDPLRGGPGEGVLGGGRDGEADAGVPDVGAAVDGRARGAVAGAVAFAELEALGILLPSDRGGEELHRGVVGAGGGVLLGVALAGAELARRAPGRAVVDGGGDPGAGEGEDAIVTLDVAERALGRRLDPVHREVAVGAVLAGPGDDEDRAAGLDVGLVDVAPEGHTGADGVAALPGGLDAREGGRIGDVGGRRPVGELVAGLHRVGLAGLDVDVAGGALLVGLEVVGHAGAVG
jgi:hypothetical protein